MANCPSVMLDEMDDSEVKTGPVQRSHGIYHICLRKTLENIS
jgi:hypothetical protein